MPSSTSYLPHDAVHATSSPPDGASTNPSAATTVPVVTPTRCSTLGLYQAAGVPAAAAALAPSPSPSSTSTPSMKASNAVSIITIELPRALSTRSSTTDTDNGQATFVFLIMKGIRSASAVKIDNDFAAVERYYCTFGVPAHAFRPPPEPPWVFASKSYMDNSCTLTFDPGIKFRCVSITLSTCAVKFLYCMIIWKWWMYRLELLTDAAQVDNGTELPFEAEIGGEELIQLSAFSCSNFQSLHSLAVMNYKVQQVSTWDLGGSEFFNSFQHPSSNSNCNIQYYTSFRTENLYRLLKVHWPPPEQGLMILYPSISCVSAWQIPVADMSPLNVAFYIVLYSWRKDQINFTGLSQCEETCLLYMASALIAIISNIRLGQCYRQPKPPWQLCTEASFSWFGEMELINGFFLEASSRCRDSVLFLQRKISGAYPAWLYSSRAKTIESAVARCVVQSFVKPISEHSALSTWGNSGVDLVLLLDSLELLQQKHEASFLTSMFVIPQIQRQLWCRNSEGSYKKEELNLLTISTDLFKGVMPYTTVGVQLVNATDPGCVITHWSHTAITLYLWWYYAVREIKVQPMISWDPGGTSTDMGGIQIIFSLMIGLCVWLRKSSLEGRINITIQWLGHPFITNWHADKKYMMHRWISVHLEFLHWWQCFYHEWWRSENQAGRLTTGKFLQLSLCLAFLTHLFSNAYLQSDSFVGLIHEAKNIKVAHIHLLFGRYFKSIVLGGPHLCRFATTAWGQAVFEGRENVTIQLLIILTGPSNGAGGLDLGQAKKWLGLSAARREKQPKIKTTVSITERAWKDQNFEPAVPAAASSRSRRVSGLIYPSPSSPSSSVYPESR